MRNNLQRKACICHMPTVHETVFLVYSFDEFFLKFSFAALINYNLQYLSFKMVTELLDQRV